MIQYECKQCDNITLTREADGPLYCEHCGEFITDLTFERWDRQELNEWMRG